MKVAQYEVLGWHLEKATRPERDDRELLIVVKPHAKRPGTILFSSIVPGPESGAGGTDISFTLFPSTSYWATFTGALRDGPSGRAFDSLMLKRIGCCRSRAAILPRYEFQRQRFT
jgi:hypothetical protein